MRQQHELKGALGAVLDVGDGDLARVVAPGEGHVEAAAGVVAEVHGRHGLVADQHLLQRGVAVGDVRGGQARLRVQGLDVAVYPQVAEEGVGEVAGGGEGGGEQEEGGGG